jgi:CheY-like chemotaxis protein
MKVLVIEDDENKRKQIVQFLAGEFPQLEMLTAQSYQGGLRAIISDEPDVILLDMSMPSFDITADDDGGGKQAYAGREILRKMHRRGVVVPVIVVTQFDQFGDPGSVVTLGELDVRLRTAHPDVYTGSVFYSAGSDSWKADLTTRLTAVVEKGK